MPTYAFRNFSIRQKLFIGLFSIVAIMLIFSMYLLYTLSIVNKSLTTLEDNFNTLRSFSTLESNTSLLRSATRTYMYVQDSKWEDIYDETSIVISNTLEELNQIITNTESIKDLGAYEDITSQLQGIELLIISKTQKGDIEQAQELFDKRYEQQHIQASIILNKIVEREQEAVAATIKNNTNLLSTAYTTFTGIVIALIAATAAASFILTNSIARSLRPLLIAAHAIAQGDFTKRVRVRSTDEFGQLAAGFNTMTNRLQHIMTDIRKKNREVRTQNIELEKTKLRLENAVRELKQLDKVKSEFVSVAAHQLRTPLTGIKWTLHSLSEENIGKINTSQKKIVIEALGSTTRLIELVNSLLNVARLEEGMLGFSMSKQNILPIINDVANRTKKHADEKGIHFTLDIPNSTIPPLLIDEEKITIALDNLLANAVKYTPSEGSIIFRIIVKNKKVTISVKDTGIGIARDQYHRMFTKFFRSEQAQLQHTGGTGLGLYIAQKIISQHGAKISFKSTQGKGSTFFFSLPHA